MVLASAHEARLEMSTASIPLSIPKPITRKVARLRWLVRLYVVFEGIAALVVVLGSAFWIGLAIDWLFEPLPAVRVLMWLIATAIAVYVAMRFLFLRVFRRLTNSSLALLVERNFPHLRESLVTTVEAGDRSRSLPLGHATMLRHTGQEAAESISHVKLSQAFQFRPLVWKSAAATILLLSIVAFSVFQADAFGFWSERMRLSPTPWPRRVELNVVGFEEKAGKRIVNVARDDDYLLQVEASIRDGHIAPEQVEIRYRLVDGRRGRDLMTKVGVALPGRDDSQLYQYSFKNVIADLKFDLIGGDDRLTDLQLHVVQRPQIVRTVVDCEFPTYMQRPPRTIPVSSRIDLPEGAKVVCRVTSNKSLRSIRVHDPNLQEDLSCSISDADPREFNFELGIGATDHVLLITMQDLDGVKNRDPYRLLFSAVIDQLPDVSVQLRGIGSAVTPQASIPFEGRVTDEYGIAQIWFEYQVDKNSAEQRPLATQPEGRRELTEFGRFDLAETGGADNQRLVDLQPGQQLSLSLKAQDAYDLSQEPHIGASQHFLLDVVTASQLRSLLEKRELGLRQRFEAIYEKMILTGDLLARVDVSGAEDESKAEEDLQNLIEGNRMRVSGALQTVTQLSHETIGVAEAFDDIVVELVNNRVDTEELKQRLQQGIADPLREIGNALLPELEQHLQKLESEFSQNEGTKDSLQAAKTQAETVIEAMKRVLDRMLELESYNELVELLRGIVDQQEQLREMTKQQRREKLRSLLDDE